MLRKGALHPLAAKETGALDVLCFNSDIRGDRNSGSCGADVAFRGYDI